MSAYQQLRNKASKMNIDNVDAKSITDPIGIASPMNQFFRNVNDNIAKFCSQPISGFVYIKLLTNKVLPFFISFIVAPF